MTAPVLHERARGGVLLAACTIMAAAWLGPLPALALEQFAAQAALHVTLVSIAAPLLALSMAGSRFDPVGWWPRGLSPLGLSLIQAGVVWAWHTPMAQGVVRAEPGLFWMEQATVFLASALLWVSVLGGDKTTRYERVGAGIIALLMTSVHMTLLGCLSMITSSPYVGAEAVSSLADQKLGAMLILAGAAVVYSVAGALLLAGLLRPQEAASARVTTAGGRS